MRSTQIISLFIGICLTLTLAGCGGGPTGVRVTQGDTQIRKATPGTTVASSASTVVHVDMFERIATMRNGRDLPESFLIATNSAGTQTAILKARPKRAIGLRTADILEGQPQINDSIAPASATESARLAKIYRDADSD